MKRIIFGKKLHASHAPSITNGHCSRVVHLAVCVAAAVVVPAAAVVAAAVYVGDD